MAKTQAKNKTNDGKNASKNKTNDGKNASKNKTNAVKTNTNPPTVTSKNTNQLNDIKVNVIREELI